MISTVCDKLRQAIPDFPECEKPWEVLEAFRKPWQSDWSLAQMPERPIGEAAIYVGKNVVVQPYVLFSGPVILADDVRIGPFSFIRGPVYIGKGSMIGPHCEIIRTIIMENTVFAHKNSIADSIVGSRINYAGGCTSCNYPVGRNYVKIRYRGEERRYEGKYGATIEDDCQLGCLTITMPGCYIKPGSAITGTCIVYGDGQIKSFVGNYVQDRSYQP